MIDSLKSLFRDKSMEDKLTRKYLLEELSFLERIRNSENLTSAVAASGAQSVNEIHKVLTPLITLDISYRDAYMMNNLVATCVNLIADSVASVPFVLNERKEDKVSTLRKEPVIQRLNDPNQVP